MAKVSLMVGNTGAGKSTFSRKLAAQEDAHIFAIDEWMNALFMMDMPPPGTFEWAMERIERLESQLLKETLKLLGRDINVILDFGFVSKEQRMRVENFFQDANRDVSAYYFDIPASTRWERVQKRNATQAETYQFHVSKKVFDFCETIFEPMDEEERKRAVIIID